MMNITDEQGDVGEGGEEGVEEPQALLEVRLAVGRVGCARDDLVGVGPAELRRDPGGQVLG